MVQTGAGYARTRRQITDLKHRNQELRDALQDQKQDSDLERLNRRVAARVAQSSTPRTKSRKRYGKLAAAVVLSTTAIIVLAIALEFALIGPIMAARGIVLALMALSFACGIVWERAREEV